MDNYQQYEVELLRYGSNAQIKEETHCTSLSGNKIEAKNFVKDLGVLIL